MPGRHLLSLCGESKQRRTKGRRTTLSGCFPSSFGNHHPFRRIADRLRTASVRCLTLSITLGSPRDVWGSTFDFANCARTTLRYRICKTPCACAWRRTAIGRKMREIQKREKKTAPNGCLLPLLHAFAYFRRATKVGARRTGES